MTEPSSRAPIARGRLAGRRVLITGGASGIGRATGERFIEEGAQVALLDVQPLETAAGPPAGIVGIHVDLRDRAAIEPAVREAAERMGGLDGVVNCAGITGGRLLQDLDPAVWDDVIAVNLTAPYLVSRAALPFLSRADGSTIVNIASGAGMLPSAPGSAAYSASKGGLISLTRALALELAPRIRVNTIMPGIVQTPMTAGTVLAGYDVPDEAPFVRLYALKRVAQPHELADAILFLTSSESSYVTGIAMAVDGGRTFH